MQAAHVKPPGNMLTGNMFTEIKRLYHNLPAGIDAIGGGSCSKRYPRFLNLLPKYRIIQVHIFQVGFTRGMKY